MVLDNGVGGVFVGVGAYVVMPGGWLYNVVDGLGLEM